MSLELSNRSRQPAQEAWTHERLLHEQAIALGNALDKSTRTAYNSHLQSYLTFCKLHGFPVDPTSDTISFYIVYMAKHKFSAGVILVDSFSSWHQPPNKFVFPMDIDDARGEEIEEDMETVAPLAPKITTSLNPPSNILGTLDVRMQLHPNVKKTTRTAAAINPFPDSMKAILWPFKTLKILNRQSS